MSREKHVGLTDNPGYQNAAKTIEERKKERKKERRYTLQNMNTRY